MFTRCVDVYSNRVHTTNNRIIQFFFQLRLIHIMLVLPHSNGFWINFYQFGQRIRKSSPNRNRTSNSYIIIRKFLSSNFRCRINRSSSLRNNKYLYRFIESYFLDEEFGFAWSGSVSYRDRINFIGVYHRFYLFHRHGCFILWRVRIDIFVI